MPPKVKDYMQTKLVTVTPSDNLAHTRNLMLRHWVDKVLVVEEGRLEGIITMTDLLKVFSSPNLARRPLDTIPVKEIMSRDPLTIDANASIEDAARIMVKRNIGSLPVISDEDTIVGIITRRNVLEALVKTGLNKNPVVSEVMDQEPPQVSPFHTIYHVAEVMESKPYNKAIVIDNGVPIGIISRRDIIFLEPSALMSEYGQPFTKRDTPLPKGRTGGVRTYLVPVAMDVMTSNPITIINSKDVLEASKKMVDNNISFLPVVDDNGKLVGGLSILHVLATHLGLKI